MKARLAAGLLRFGCRGDSKSFSRGLRPLAEIICFKRCKLLGPGGLESRLHQSSLDKVMETDRRRAVRKRLNQLAYIRIGADNGGLISDLGEGGLGFQTIAAIEREGPLRFWFTLDSADRVQAIGELVWTDESRKVGGLRFTQISEQALEVIQNWIERSERRCGRKFRIGANVCTGSRRHV